MNQIFRNNTFETNSSAVHSLVVFKNKAPGKLADTPFNLIPLLHGSIDDVLKDPVDILSYLYTYSLMYHDWELHDTLKHHFMDKCIFEKPCWEIPFAENPSYIEDREITSFRRLANGEIPYVYFSDKDRKCILSHIDDIVFNGIVMVKRDSSFTDDILSHRPYIKEIVGEWDESKESIEEWKERHIKYLIEA